ncbi:AfsR/SARP family transcriptional regulator [Streptomyces sp. NRRL B-24484]|uniref:AfsR/SARP family transcriptional regulator n=1 Tax=Streptomyces sp. NRRL B-24484 TaxID=1463833 RepID=UPI0004C19689|nr:BTAD domain-containing putative transcriptional regulator [Streptomyces sp. NRRL B-24484]
MLDFRLLGPVEAHGDGTAVDLGPPKRRTVLAVLLLADGALVTTDRLTEALWHERPPTHARTAVQGHISKLRRALHPTGRAAIVTAGDGYLLRTPADRVDVRRFRAGVLEARRIHRGAAPAAVPVLRSALRLWRGPALAGLCPTPLIASLAAELEDARLIAVEELGQALTAGHLAEEAVGLLRGPAGRHPLRESLVAPLLDALLATDRQAAAIELYHETVRRLAEELGVGPGPAMTRAYARILAAPDHAHPTAAAPARPGTPAGGRGAPPLLLPRGPAGFTGRTSELAALDATLTAAPDAPVCLVTGPAGVGKSALVAHWAQHAAPAFPDGVLYARLGGFAGTVPAADPAFVLRDFLVALGTRPDDVPQNPVAAESHYRTLLRHRRTLVILDDALDHDQVRRLLPGAAGCATVVTSRNRMESLVAGDCARPLLVDRLGPQDGAALLSAVLGAERVAAEPDAAAHLVRLCDGLPLALRLTGARLATRPQRPLREAADELHDEQQRLALLAAGDVDLASVLRAGVAHLPPAAADLLGLLAHHLGPDIDLGGAAALAAAPPADTRAVLDRLVAANLLEERPGGRYALHDLVRLYARTLRPAPGPERILPLLDHYLRSALAASAAAVPGSQPCCALPADVRPAVVVPDFTDRAGAMAWYARERVTLVAAVAAAAGAGHHDRAWRLAALLWPLVVQQPEAQWDGPLGRALASAAELADADAESRVRTLLGWVLTQQARHEEAARHLEPAPDLARRAGDLEGEAIAIVNLAQLHDRLGRPATAGRGYERAHLLARDAGSPQTQMLTTYYLARHHLDNARPARALALARDGLGLAPADQVPARRAMLTDLCGQALLALDRQVEASEHFTRAARLAEQDGFTADAAAYDARAAETGVPGRT